MNVQHEIVLAGNPNCGKTSVFNLLCKTHQKVGNYPGVTVEKKTGLIFLDQAVIRVTDLPGTYSIQPSSLEEKVARRWLMDTSPRLIVNIVDGTNLERGLYLTLQLMELGRPQILVINMADEMERSGIELDTAALQEELRIPVILTAAARKESREPLLNFILPHLNQEPQLPDFPTELNPTMRESIQEILEEAPKSLILEWKVRPEWVALSLLENDASLMERFEGLGHTNLLESARNKASRIHAFYDESPMVLATEARHRLAQSLTSRHQKITQIKADFRETLDTLLLSRIFGLPIFLGIVYLTFQLVFTVGSYPMDWIDALFGFLGEEVARFWPKASDSSLRSLILDGIIGGVGGVIIFLPNIVLLFTAIAFLEGTGYMARAAFLMDRLMRGFGLHGKSFMPLASGLGCTVPSIMATRILENRSDRMITLFMLPMVSCSARLPIYGLLIPVFFPLQYRGAVLMAVYLAGFFILIAGAWVLRLTHFKSEASSFMLELPPLRMPTMGFVVAEMWHRSSIYLRKAGTIILACSLILWAMSRWPRLPEEHLGTPPAFTFSENARIHKLEELWLNTHAISQDFWDFAPEYKKAEKGLLSQAQTLGITQTITLASLEEFLAELPEIQEKVAYHTEAVTDFENHRTTEELAHSLAGRIGKFVEPVFTPVGFDWKISTALIGAIAAKEVFVTQFGIIYELGSEIDLDAESDMERENDGTRLGQALLRDTYPEDHQRAGQKVFHPLVAVSLMIFCLVSSPCMATIAVTIRETGSWLWGFWQFFGFTFLAWILALIIYQGGMALGFGP